MARRFDEETEWTLKQYDGLVGGTIVGTIVDPDGNGYESFCGIQVKMPSGAVKNVWVQRDTEGNGPGFLAIEDERHEAIAPPQPPSPPSLTPPTGNAVDRPEPLPEVHVGLDEWIDTKVDFLGEGEKALIEALKVEALTDGNISQRRDCDIDDALRLAEEGVLEMWQSGQETTFYINPLELCIDRIIRHMRRSRDNYVLPQMRLERDIDDWKVMIDVECIMNAIAEMQRRGQAVVRPDPQGGFPNVSLLFSRGLDCPDIFTREEVETLKALTADGVDCLNLTELREQTGGRKNRLMTVLAGMVEVGRLEKVEEKRGRCKYAYRVTEKGEQHLARALRCAD